MIWEEIKISERNQKEILELKNTTEMKITQGIQQQI